MPGILQHLKFEEHRPNMLQSAKRQIRPTATTTPPLEDKNLFLVKI